jgi:biopolymer transport protein ExbD
MCLFVVAIFWPRVWPAPDEQPVSPDEQPELVFPAEVVLPEIPGVNAGGKGALYPIYLNVTEQGQVILVPSAAITDARGNVTNALDNAAQVETFLKRRAKEDEDKSQRSTIILRVDARTPFEKTHDIVRAALSAGYVRFRWTARWGALQSEWPRDVQYEVVNSVEEEAHGNRKYSVRLTSEAGKLAKITLRGPEMAEGVDLGTDFDALFRELTAAQKKHMFDRSLLTAEIDGRLLQADVIRLFDAAVRAGFLDVVPLLLDPKKR